MDSLRLVDGPKLVARLRALLGDAAGRQRAARWLAPAAFLLAVTAVVLVVRSSLRGGDGPVTATAPAVVRTTKKAPLRPPAIASVPKQYYVLTSGDTLDAVAAQFGTTTAVLLGLNPGVEPTALHAGQRVRVK